MNSDLLGAELLLIAALALVGVAMQIRLYVRSDRKHFPRRLYIPIAVGGLIVIGSAFRLGLTYIDQNKANPTFGEGSWIMGRALLFLVLLVTMAYIGPLSVCGSLIWTVYLGFEYQDWRLWPLLDLVFDLAFDGLPRWLSLLYKAFAFLYFTLSSVAEGALDATTATPSG